MQLMALARNSAGESLIPPCDEKVAAGTLLETLLSSADSIQALNRSTSRGVAFQGEALRTVVDGGDPRSAGWTVLIHAQDDKNHALREAIAPLTAHRGADPARPPLLYRDEPMRKWGDWLHEQHWKDSERPPAYILIVGGPSKIPFRFQSFLQTFARVGRVEFDSLEELRTYVSKLIRLEQAAKPVVQRRALMLATDDGPSDPTHYSREYMVAPLAAEIRERTRLEVVELTGDDATKEDVVRTFTSHAPALVYTASHGYAALDKDLSEQRRLNGAICCQRLRGPFADSLFTADDVPQTPFLEGAMFFQFACFGYGTPQRSDFEHWFSGQRKHNSSEDFVAALPKKLLAHPRGPIAYVGHVDLALLHGFTDADSPMLTKRWHTRLAPFQSAIRRLLAVDPAGLAMERMNQKYAAYNALISGIYDDHKSGDLDWSEDAQKRFVDNWLIRNDSQNFMVFGDPAARLRIPSEEETHA